MSYIKLKNVKKEYIMGEVKIIAAHDVSFEIEKGELVVILGPSGAGKTTILNLLGGMDNATSGQIIVDNEDITSFKRKELIGYRRNSIGFVFQFYNLVQNLTALENVELAVQICKNPLKPEKVLEEVGLKDRMNNFPGGLSGGEQQRVAIARAIAKNPKLLLCDEPTGALDYHTSKDILELLEQINQDYGTTILIVTHNDAIAKMAHRVLRLRDGQIISNYLNTSRINAKELEW